MRLLHGFNVGLYLVNSVVWFFGAHSNGMALLTLGGAAVASIIWKLEP